MRGTVGALLGLAVWTLVQVGCAPREPVREGVEASLLTSLQAYNDGDGVMFVLQVTNTSETALEVTYPTGQSYDFAVYDGDREVWRWSADQAFTQAVREERIEAGETLRFEESWTPPAAERGERTAVGTLTATEARVEQRTRFELP